MGAILRVIVKALLDWLVEQTPTIIAAWQKYQARQAAVAQRAADQQKIDDYIKANGGKP